MRIAACTAVVTEISHKTGRSIEADVSFLSRDEWKAELDGLLSDLTDEDGNIKRVSDLKSEAGVAWHKVSGLFEPETRINIQLRYMPCIPTSRKIIWWN